MLESYNRHVEDIRDLEYPMLQDTVYLDHAGTTIPAKSLMERFSADMISNLYANPHSASSASQDTSKRVEDARLRLLHLFNADPEEFDVVFVANATAGIKLVMEAFRDYETGFWYGYHRDSHTSLVGLREVAREQRCFGSDSEVEEWLQTTHKEAGSRLFAYPAQSNMNGRRLPLHWCQQICQLPSTYSLLDAAALVSTSPFDLSNVSASPDFTVMSLYKIFGFPDLGALIVKKSADHVFQSRKYFGGGTVDMVVCLKEQWHARKSDTLHEQLEDGTLPIHSIMALHSALDVHQELYGSLDRISSHCAFLAERLYSRLAALRHANGQNVCEMYKDPSSDYNIKATHGPIVAMNIRNAHGGWVANSEVEKLASIRHVQLRTGGLCNPGGTASSLDLEPWEMERNFSAGHRCGNENDIMHGKPTGIIRLSLGAMTTLRDVDSFLDFMEEYFVENELDKVVKAASTQPNIDGGYYVESLTVYPIKSCAGYKIPPQVAWYIHQEGLAWDREWCLIRPGSGAALSQKRYPRMALIRPSIDLDKGILRVEFADATAGIDPINLPLSRNPSLFTSKHDFTERNTRVCGDTITARTYPSPAITNFFTRALGVACQLVRFPANRCVGSSRHTKAHLQPFQQRKGTYYMPGTFPNEGKLETLVLRPILFSNESPILLISRSSLNRLNEQIKSNGGKAVHAEVFRANIVVAEYHKSTPAFEQPYAEDFWQGLQIGNQVFQILGGCQRCQMVCIDQETAQKHMEPFSTLAKTRRFEGRVYFGQHTCHVNKDEESLDAQGPTIMVTDAVKPLLDN
ncbi:PLP-dependent transferase [Tothia fuscella]|uniref:Molybdenum cofactor sulfurase n=1 Tax=Tothia fuscella TaxID=1048955 RepID=A0A9P4NYZ2_9PEZI|nr:PLP-dependent transferase [Tothia fuscella]